jgi:hypothetical protein
MFQLLDNFLTSRTSENTRYITKFWFILSLFFAFFYSIVGLQKAFSSEYVAGPDTDQLLFWTQRYVNPDLFPGDWIADYIQSGTSWGIKFIYWLAAKLGVEPLTFSKILPLLLSVGATIYIFGLSLEIFPVPFTAFMITLMLNQNHWVRGDWNSASPRAFGYLSILMFLFYLLRKSYIPMLISLVFREFLSYDGIYILDYYCFKNSQVLCGK